MPAKRRSAATTKPPAPDRPWNTERCRAIADRLDGYIHTQAVEARCAIRYLLAENERLAAVTAAAHSNGDAAALVRGHSLTPARH